MSINKKEPQFVPTLPPMPSEDDWFSQIKENSLMALRLTRQGVSDDRIKGFFNKVFTLDYLRYLDRDTGSPEIAFAKTLNYAWAGSPDISTDRLLPNKVVFAFSGGYIFESAGKIQIYAAKNPGHKSYPFGDVHDLAHSQFKEFGEELVLAQMPKSHRCLVLQTFDLNNQQVEYHVIPVETIHSSTGMREGETVDAAAEKDFTAKQVVEATERYSLASYSAVNFLIVDEAIKTDVEKLLGNVQLGKKLHERLSLRLEVGMDPEEAARAYLREKILSQNGVKDAFQ